MKNNMPLRVYSKPVDEHKCGTKGKPILTLKAEQTELYFSFLIGNYFFCPKCEVVFENKEQRDFKTEVSPVYTRGGLTTQNLCVTCRKKAKIKIYGLMLKYPNQYQPTLVQIFSCKKCGFGQMSNQHTTYFFHRLRLQRYTCETSGLE